MVVLGVVSTIFDLVQGHGLPSSVDGGNRGGRKEDGIVKIRERGFLSYTALTSRLLCAPWKSTSCRKFVPEFDPHAHSYIQMIENEASIVLRIERLNCLRDIKSIADRNIETGN
jgi:hypothetical protein